MLFYLIDLLFFILLLMFRSVFCFLYYMLNILNLKNVLTRLNKFLFWFISKRVSKLGKLFAKLSLASYHRLSLIAKINLYLKDRGQAFLVDMIWFLWLFALPFASCYETRLNSNPFQGHEACDMWRTEIMQWKKEDTDCLFCCCCPNHLTFIS